MTSRTAAIIASVILFGVAIFQLLLAAGLPFGHYAWGGAYEISPTSLRIGSVIAIFIYILAALIILSRASVIGFIRNKKITHYGTWTLTVLFGIGVIMNAISRSENERLIMTPVVLLLFILCFVVVRSKAH